uniref:U-box domain-containing protein n=1 Tax=Chenopodium quinoa TaxID=63459 RepID=A0A803LXM6_CHEQI
MKDPVTTPTGITYDRSSIERWLKEAVVNEPVCPVTKQPLPSQHLTPNHTLRRLIQGWCVANANLGVERIPTPKPVLCRAHVLKILRGLSVPRLQSTSLDQLLSLISTSSGDEHAKDDDRKLMAECGVVKAMVSLIITCYKDNKTTFLTEALRILTVVWVPANVSSEVRSIVADNIDLVDAITWVLFDKSVERRTLTVNLINEVVKVAGSSLIERLKPEFFK